MLKVYAQGGGGSSSGKKVAGATKGAGKVGVFGRVGATVKSKVQGAVSRVKNKLGRQ